MRSPVPLSKANVILRIHSRLDADPEHRWLKEKLTTTCRTVV